MAPPVFLIMYRMKEGLLKSAPSLSQIFTDKKYGNHEAEFPLGSHSSKNSWAITSIALPVQVYALSRKALPVSASKFSAQPSFCTIRQKAPLFQSNRGLNSGAENPKDGKCPVSKPSPGPFRFMFEMVKNIPLSFQESSASSRTASGSPFSAVSRPAAPFPACRIGLKADYNMFQF